MILTFEPFYQHFNHEEADCSALWGAGRFHWVILDRAHRLRTSGTPISKFRKPHGSLVEMNSRIFILHMVSCILSLEPQYKWMLTATPLVNFIDDWHWILRFLESSSRLTVQLRPDTFKYTLNIDDEWVADGSNESGTERGAEFTPVADLYENGPEFGSSVHCTNIAQDTYMLPRIDEVGKFCNTTQTSDILIRRHRYVETIGK